MDRLSCGRFEMCAECVKKIRVRCRLPFRKGRRMKHWSWVGLLGVSAFLGAVQPAAAQTVLASSHFDAGAEGWQVQDLAYPNAGAPPNHLATYSPTYNSTGGNPGGHLQMVDPSGNAWYWYAPAAFLGNQAGAYGGKLSYQLKATGGTALFSQEDVILVGGGITLVRGNLAPPGPAFATYNLNLSEAGWTRNNMLGAAATAADMQAVLSNLTHIYIRGEYHGDTDTGYLDNVVLTSAPPAAAVPEPSSVLLFLPALAVAGMVRRRRSG